ncbi:MAG TPA: hypothetical protein VE338_19825 [Ktedonobacterales bacterium]|jgi:hypothetical protein|nr:hypothetical protein [Ktedonobacterales bacterium]
MDSSLTARSRRQVNLIAVLAVALIFVFGIIIGSIAMIVSIIGGAVALIAWAYALVTAARMRQMGWIILLIVGLLAALALGAYAYTHPIKDVPNENILGVLQLGLLPLAFIAMSYGSLGGAPMLERGVSAFYGTWGLLSLVIGGTLVGGAIGTSIGAGAEYITALGFRLYVVAGVLALIAWIAGLVVGLRTKSWGWFALIILLPGIGAFMFGLFGPTRQDVLMAQENRRQRRAVGLS